MGFRTVRIHRAAFSIVAVMLLILTACTESTEPTISGTKTPGSSPTTRGPTPTLDPRFQPDAYSPQRLRDAYGVTSLINQGYTGKGQTVVVIDSFGSPTLQDDLDTFNQRFNLPPLTVQQLAPLGTKPFDPNDRDMEGWAGETNLDVQIIHAIAPGAKIVVLTSPIAETEGTIGLPEFRQLEVYAVQNHLGNIISQSWGVSEVTLTDKAGQDEIAKWTEFYHQATTQQGITFTTGSGDNGATDYQDLQATVLSPTPTTSFPSDEPWVLSAGGTTLLTDGQTYRETAWRGSGGGFSRFFPTPDFQKNLSADAEQLIAGRRAVPDIASDGNPRSGMIFYFQGQEELAGGTSAAAPLWAAIAAIANQMAGHPLGYLNPALYKLAASDAYARDFRDVTYGNNGVSTQGVSIPGYNAVSGWDAVTGLGSPLADKLLPDLITAVGT